jgi:hypothetical protein
MNPDLKRDALLAATPVSARTQLAKALEGKASPRAAIKAMCLTCCNFDRDEIIACTTTLCPLHAYRPFLVKRKRYPVGGSSADGQTDATAQALVPTRPTRKLKEKGAPTAPD